MTGLVVTCLDRKKFGFIRPDGSDEEIFFHFADLPNRQGIPVNTRVEFELGIYGGRNKAVNVRVAK